MYVSLSLYIYIYILALLLYACREDHILQRTHSIEDTFYREHILERTHSIENTFYREHILERTHSIEHKYLELVLLLRAGKEGDALAQDLHVYTRTCAQMRVRSRDLTHFTPNSIFLLRFVLIFFCCPSPQGSAELSKTDCPTEKMPNWQCRIEIFFLLFQATGPHIRARM